MASRSRRSASMLFSARLLLLGDIEGNADQVMAAFGAAAQLATHPKPDPVSVGVLHAEGLVDMVDLACDQLLRDREQVDVVGFHQRIDLAEGQQVAARVEPKHGEHRLRPEDPAARQVPVPQPAAAAVERGIDPAAHGVVDQVALAGAGGLPVEGEAEDQHDEARGGRQRHRERGIGAPHRLDIFLQHDHAAGQGLDQHRRHQRAIAARQDDVVDLALQARRAQQLRRADGVEDAVGLAEARLGRDAGEDAAIGTRDDDMAACGDAPGGDQVREHELQPLDVGEAVLPDGGEAIDAFGEVVGQRGKIALIGPALLPALIQHLDEGAEADGDQEGDDEGRHCAAQCGLGGQQPVVGRLCDRLRQSLDRIGLGARVRCMRTRHALVPRRKIDFNTRPERTPRRFRINLI